DDVVPAGANLIEDRLDRLHCPRGLLLNRMRVHVLVIHMRMLVVKRRWSGPRQEHQVARSHYSYRRRVRHGMRLLGLWMYRRERKARLGFGHGSQRAPPSANIFWGIWDGNARRRNWLIAGVGRVDRRVGRANVR